MFARFSAPWLAWRMLVRLARIPSDLRRHLSHHRAVSAAPEERDAPADQKVITLMPGQFEGSKQRTGWGIALRELHALNSPDGIAFDGFMESNFCWKWKSAENRLLGRIPYRAPWMGFTHFPPNIPEWSYPGGTWQDLLRDERWLRSAPLCAGLFALTEYHAEWLRRNLDVPCAALLHPVLPSGTPFSMDAFRANRRKGLVMIGWWLRKLDTFYALKTPMKKTFVFSNSVGALLYADRYRRHVGAPFVNDTVDVVDFVPSGEFDRMLSENLVFLDVLDTSANNIVLDCIVRATPILANRHPATEEYLGKDYPLFFSSIEEASAMLRDERLIAQAHEYLLSMDKTRFSPESFRRALVDSDVFRSAKDAVHARRANAA